ncbi:hypothetical protein AB6D11_00950 [Vibrio splendidus]
MNLDTIISFERDAHAKVTCIAHYLEQNDRPKALAAMTLFQHFMDTHYTPTMRAIIEALDHAKLVDLECDQWEARNTMMVLSHQERLTHYQKTLSTLQTQQSRDSIAHAELLETHQELVGSHTRLGETYQVLVDSYNVLDQNHHRMVDSHAQLEQDHQQVMDRELSLSVELEQNKQQTEEWKENAKRNQSKFDSQAGRLQELESLQPEKTLSQLTKVTRKRKQLHDRHKALSDVHQELKGDHVKLQRENQALTQSQNKLNERVKSLEADIEYMLGKSSHSPIKGLNGEMTYFITEFEFPFQTRLSAAQGIQVFEQPWHFQLMCNTGVAASVALSEWLTPIIPFSTEMQADWNPEIDAYLHKHYLKRLAITHPNYVKMVQASKDLTLKRFAVERQGVRLLSDIELEQFNQAGILTVFEAVCQTFTHFSHRFELAGTKLTKEQLANLYQKGRFLANALRDNYPDLEITFETRPLFDESEFNNQDVA